MNPVRKQRRNQVTMPDFRKENEILESAAQENSRLRQQINKQTHSDSIVQSQIQSKISQVKEKAVELAKFLQGQKRKNIELEAIIRNMNYLREQQRRTEANQNSNEQNTQTFSRKIKKLEYSLQQLYSKTNNLNSKTKNRKIEVDTFRTQRVIDSNIFDKLEKELKSYEIDYKKLLIQKIKLQKEYTKNLDNYNKIKQQIMIDTNNTKNGSNVKLSKRKIEREESSKKKLNVQEEFFINAPEIQQAVKFTQLNINVNVSKKSSAQPSKRNLQNGAPSGFSNYSNFKKQGVSKEQNQVYECKLQKILMESGLENYEDFIDSMNSLQQKIQELYNESNFVNDEIANKNQQLLHIQHQIKKKQVKYYTVDEDEDACKNKEQKRIKDYLMLKNNVEATQIQLEKEYQNIVSLFKSIEFKAIIEECPNSKIKQVPQQSLDDFQDIFKLLEPQLQTLIQHFQQQYQQKLIQQSQEDESLKNSTNLKKLKQNDALNNQGTGRSNIQDLINKVKKLEPSEKIMDRSEFKKEYEHLRKTGANKNQRNMKKTTQIKRQRVGGSLY